MSFRMAHLNLIATLLCDSFKMADWLQKFILCCVLNCLVSCAPPSVLHSKYNNSFHLTRSTRTRVQQLERKYKEQQLGDRHFEDRSRLLKELPSLSTDFYTWLNLTDWERLHAALWDIQAYWNTLERKRKQLEEEKEETVQMVGPVVRNTLPRGIKHIQVDLQDLMGQVRSQMSNIQGSQLKLLTPPTGNKTLTSESDSKTVWDRRVEGYVILRDLGLYLTKLAKDFRLLAFKTFQKHM